MAIAGVLKPFPTSPLPMPKSVLVNANSEAGQQSGKWDDNGSLLLACFKGDNNRIHQLLRNSADINTKCARTGWTPLIAAALSGHASVVKMLCEAEGVDINARDHGGLSALGHAIMIGSVHMVQCLCQKSANVNRELYSGVSALELAITCEGYPEIVTALLDCGEPNDKKKMDNLVKLAKLYNRENLVNILKQRKKTIGRGKAKQGRKDIQQQSQELPDKKLTNLAENSLYDKPVHMVEVQESAYSTVRSALGAVHKDNSEEIGLTVEENPDNDDSLETNEESIYGNWRYIYHDDQPDNELGCCNDDKDTDSVANQTALYYEILDLEDGAMLSLNDEDDDEGEYANGRVVQVEMGEKQKVQPSTLPHANLSNTGRAQARSTAGEGTSPPPAHTVEETGSKRKPGQGGTILGESLPQKSAPPPVKPKPGREVTKVTSRLESEASNVQAPGMKDGAADQNSKDEKSAFVNGTKYSTQQMGKPAVRPPTRPHSASLSCPGGNLLVAIAQASSASAPKTTTSTSGKNKAKGKERSRPQKPVSGEGNVEGALPKESATHKITSWSKNVVINLHVGCHNVTKVYKQTNEVYKYQCEGPVYSNFQEATNVCFNSSVNIVGTDGSVWEKDSESD